MKGVVYHPAFFLCSRLISILISPLYIFINLFRTYSQPSNLNNCSILVSEYHRIGDILLIEPALRSIKKTFPRSHLMLICNPQAEKLAKDLKLADEIIIFQAPWTNWEWSLFKWVKAKKFAKSLGKKKIDIAINFKGDLRDSWFIWHLKAKYSLGYSKTGGSFFYSNSHIFPDKLHQQDRALELISNIGCKKIIAKQKVNFNASGSIVFHNGASDPRRKWPDKHWFDLLKLFSEMEHITVVKTDETLSLITLLNDTDIEFSIYEGNLISFSNWLKNQKVLICPDSMAGHLAARNNIPVVSLFGSQDPSMTAPISQWVSVIKPDLQCNHIRDHWRFCQACMHSINPKIVFENTKKLLNSLINK